MAKKKTTKKKTPLTEGDDVFFKLWEELIEKEPDSTKKLLHAANLLRLIHEHILGDKVSVTMGDTFMACVIFIRAYQGTIPKEALTLVNSKPGTVH